MLVARNLGVPEPGAVDAELLAQAGGARPADGRRRARGEEPAQRDDDSPRAAASRSSSRQLAAAGDAPVAAATARPLVGAGPDVDASTSTSSASEIRRLDEVVQRIPEVRAARRAEAAAGAAVGADLATSSTIGRAGGRAQARHHDSRTARATCPTINADPAMLRQALLNLALNACQAMPDGGTLRIACRPAARRTRRGRRRGHRRRHSAGASAAHLRSLFHDQGKGQRHRPVDGLSHRPAARRRSRSAVDAGARNTLPADASRRHDGAWCGRLRRGVVDMRKLLLWIAVASAAASGGLRLGAGEIAAPNDRRSKCRRRRRG